MNDAIRSSLRHAARVAVSLGLPSAILQRGPALQGTKFLAHAAFKARFGQGRPFRMVNVGACDGALFDDVTPWLKRIPGSRAVLVEPIPYNQVRLRKNYPDTERFVIEPVAVTREKGTISVKTFDAAALESGKLPMEFIGCSTTTDTNLMSGVGAWGETDTHFQAYTPYLKDIEVASDTLQDVLDRNGVDYIDAFLVDCEGADWIVFDQLDLDRYRPGMIKVELGSLRPEDVGRVLVKLTTAGYRIGIYSEDVWAFA
ncbi:FkbM family methyltransferase [Aquibium sp. LZ166]|uniref:FkbM family methyltransferase n=1 Tax=Aquibium pacificus TaxID=3153579 RepID=A0ABV3SK58_9HYPH